MMSRMNACNCTLPSITGSTKCCENCANNVHVAIDTEHAQYDYPLQHLLTADKKRYEDAYDAGYKHGKDERYVMCKDCKHYDAENGDCDEICHLVGDEDYCSFGEIKEIDEDGAVIDG